MPLRIQVSATPNPNSLKISVEGFKLVEAGSATFDSAAAAAAHPLARRLFQEPGVRSVFMLGGFVAVTKAPEADWGNLAPRLEAAVRAHFEGT